MLVQIRNKSNFNCDREWCLLEFQGDIIGDLNGNVLGDIEIKDVIKPFIIKFKLTINIII